MDAAIASAAAYTIGGVTAMAFLSADIRGRGRRDLMLTMTDVVGGLSLTTVPLRTILRQLRQRPR